MVPGLSFAELAWTRLGVDPMAVEARIVDGRAFDAATVAMGGPMLVGQCDTRLVLSDVKVTLLDHLAPDAPVTILHHLGLPDERVDTVALSELDRVLEPDHLTAVWVPGAALSATTELARLLALAVRLRAPDGCPWDAEQTHHSLTRYLLEESYEVVEAVELLPPDAPAGTAPDDPAYVALVDELGDLLYQVIFHAVLAEEAGAFGMAEIARGIHDKLVRRHPHVFGDVDADTSADVMANWEQIKKVEKGTESIVAGITPGLPSLLYAHKLLRKGASVGLDPGDVAESLARIDAATAALRSDAADPEAVLGALLAAAVALARGLGRRHGVGAARVVGSVQDPVRSPSSARRATAASICTRWSAADVEALWADLPAAILSTRARRYAELTGAYRQHAGDRVGLGVVPHLLHQCGRRWWFVHTVDQETGPTHRVDVTVERPVRELERDSGRHFVDDRWRRRGTPRCASTARRPRCRGSIHCPALAAAGGRRAGGTARPEPAPARCRGFADFEVVDVFEDEAHDDRIERAGTARQLLGATLGRSAGHRLVRVPRLICAATGSSPITVAPASARWRATCPSPHPTSSTRRAPASCLPHEREDLLLVLDVGPGRELPLPPLGVRFPPLLAAHARILAVSAVARLSFPCATGRSTVRTPVTPATCTTRG